MTLPFLCVALFVLLKISTTYRAFVCLPNRQKYQTCAEVEKFLSYDQQALDALSAACRQESTQRGAWNLLLLACSRALASYISPRKKEIHAEELDELLKFLVEAIAKEKSPLSYLRCAVKDARKSRKVEQERDADYVQETQDNGALFVVPSGEGKTWANWSPASDPFLLDRIMKAVERLSPQLQRCALLMMQGCKAVEIAEKLKVKPLTAKDYIKEVRKFLSPLFPDRLP